jgi:hypothetical protein
MSGAQASPASPTGRDCIRVSADSDLYAQAGSDLYNLQSRPLHAGPLHAGPLHAGPLHAGPLLTGGRLEGRAPLPRASARLRIPSRRS